MILNVHKDVWKLDSNTIFLTSYIHTVRYIKSILELIVIEYRQTTA